MVEIYRRRGRSLSPTIAQSKKVAKLSRGAIIIYTWGLAFFDDYGWGEGDPEDVKNLIVPRLDFTIDEITKCLKEICEVHLWVPYKFAPWEDLPEELKECANKIFVRCLAWNTFQKFKAIHKVHSEVSDLIENNKKYLTMDINLIYPYTMQTPESTNEHQLAPESTTLAPNDDLVLLGAKGVPKRREVKLREDKIRINTQEGIGVERGTNPKQNTLLPQLVDPGIGKDNGKIDAKGLADLYLSLCPNLSGLQEIRSRAPTIRVRLKEHPDPAFWENVFKKANFIEIGPTGIRPGWKPDFDWLIKNKLNAVRVVEGKYDNLIMQKMSGGHGGLMELAKERGLLDEHGPEEDPGPEEGG